MEDRNKVFVLNNMGIGTWDSYGNKLWRVGDQAITKGKLSDDPFYFESFSPEHKVEKSILFAPDYWSKLSPTPIGYFIYQVIWDYLYQTYTDVEGVFDWKRIEAKHISLSTRLLERLLCKENRATQSFVSTIIDAVAEVTHTSLGQPIMLNKHDSLSLNELKKIYIEFDRYYTMQLQYKKINYMKIVEEIENLIGKTLPRQEISSFKERNLHGHPAEIQIEQDEEAGRTEKPLRERVDEEKRVFGWSVFNSSLEFWSEMQMGVLSKADELGIRVISHDEKSNSVEMLVGSFDLIKRGVNALLIAPYNPELLPVIVEEAQIQKIPVISIDIGTGGADVAAFIVSDSFGGGVFAGEYALSLIKKYKIESKNVAIIKVQKTAPYALLRGEGFKSVLLDKGYKVVAEVPANSEELLAYEVTKDLLNVYKDDLAVIFCENGTMTLGAAKAIEEVGKKGIIMLIGFDSTPSVIEGIKKGDIQGTIGQQPFKMGEIGVEVANSILSGIPVTFDDWNQKLILMEVFLVDESGEIKGEVV